MKVDDKVDIVPQVVVRFIVKLKALLSVSVQLNTNISCSGGKLTVYRSRLQIKQLFWMSVSLALSISRSCAKESIMIPKTTFKIIVVMIRKNPMSKKKRR